MDSLPENKGKLLDEIKEDVSDAYSKEKISELHYSLLERSFQIMKKIKKYKHTL